MLSKNRQLTHPERPRAAAAGGSGRTRTAAAGEERGRFPIAAAHSVVTRSETPIKMATSDFSSRRQETDDAWMPRM